MFIVGGLIVVAVLAIVGAFLLARSGGKPEQGAPSPQESVTAQLPVEHQNQPDAESVDIHPLAPEVTPQVHAQTAIAEIPTATLPAATSEPPVVTDVTEPLRLEIKMLQDHIYQLTEQLQVLNSHTQEIEQRLDHIYATLPHQRSDDPTEGPQLPFPEESRLQGINL
ncbi:hypothetical protein [Ktedonospora formicarum]|uniref:Uncharacterized protein n=1 Tax=Ktedonospora formicarum TaxID=2778364 RepID=A0A8J3MRS5_9CHLR|nr:hypothetical protein [Ktedonospora formicarum]GHO42575.1 hypothetical protein KSX_07380 [Ktedonospora formicarum]